MFCCSHDPGLALFLAETADDDLTLPDRLQWAALTATLVLAVAILIGLA